MKVGELIEVLGYFDNDTEVEVCGVCDNPLEPQTALCDVVYTETRKRRCGDMRKVCLRYE